LTWLASVADEIKFARLGVGEEHLKHAFAQAKGFVNECEAHRRATVKGAHDVFIPVTYCCSAAARDQGGGCGRRRARFQAPFSSTHFAIRAARTWRQRLAWLPQHYDLRGLQLRLSRWLGEGVASKRWSTPKASRSRWSSTYRKYAGDGF